MPVKNACRLAGLRGLLLLAACVSPEEQRARDQSRCQGFGFQPGTDAMANCLLQTVQQRDAETAANRRAWEHDRMVSQQMQAQRNQAAQAQQAAADEAHRDAIQQMMRSGGPTGFNMPHTSPMQCTTVSAGNAGSMICH